MIPTIKTWIRASIIAFGKECQQGLKSRLKPKSLEDIPSDAVFLQTNQGRYFAAIGLAVATFSLIGLIEQAPTPILSNVGGVEVFGFRIYSSPPDEGIYFLSAGNTRLLSDITEWLSYTIVTVAVAIKATNKSYEQYGIRILSSILGAATCVGLLIIFAKPNEYWGAILNFSIIKDQHYIIYLGYIVLVMATFYVYLERVGPSHFELDYTKEQFPYYQENQWRFIRFALSIILTAGIGAILPFLLNQGNPLFLQMVMVLGVMLTLPLTILLFFLWRLRYNERVLFPRLQEK